MMELFIDAVGLAAPGMSSWDSALPVLKGEQPYQAEPLDRYKPMLLPANERRRATELVRLAFRVCEDATRENEGKLEHLASVFASSCGDCLIVDQVCRALCRPERMVSPTQFHNSVHNSAAGYWSIATKSRAPSTSLSAYDHSFAAGLIEAATMVCVEQQPTLLAAYDTQPPEPLLAKRPIDQPFAVAFLLTAKPSKQTKAKISLQLIAEEPETPTESLALEAIRNSNPAARSLPLVELLAKQQSGSIHLAATGNQTLMVDLQPCL